MIKCIAHVAFHVADMEKSLDFYCRVLPFKKAFEMKNPKDGSPWIVYVSIGGGQFIELFYGAKDPSEVTSDRIGYSHLCLEVEDIHDIAKRVIDAGVELETPVQFGVDDNWQCWVRDPDRNRIEFMQMGADSLQLKYLRSLV